MIFERQGVRVIVRHSGWLPNNAAAPKPETASVDLRIEEAKNGKGFFLISKSDNARLPGGDTWHKTLEEAFEQARNQFGVDKTGWVEVDA